MLDTAVRLFSQPNNYQRQPVQLTARVSLGILDSVLRYGLPSRVSINLLLLYTLLC